MQVEIVIKKPANEKLGTSLEVLIDFLGQIQGREKGTILKINMQNIDFTFPLTLIPIASYVSYLSSFCYDIDFVYNKNIQEYLNVIKFPKGLSYECNDFANELNKYKTKTYLPICSIPSGLNNSKIREEIISLFETILVSQTKIRGQLKIAVSYIINETIDNIVEHANVSNGWIMAQNYPTKGFLDVCIADTGDGILESYRKAKISNISTDAQAINKAINGLSTKEQGNTRGFGLKTSRKMLVEGLGGMFMLFSGDSFYIWTPNIETIFSEIPYKWKGTIVAVRIPHTIPSNFNYTNYLE